jgi:hypothetical protein
MDSSQPPRITAHSCSKLSAQYVHIFLSKTLLIQVLQISSKEMRMHFVFLLYGLNLYSQFGNNKLYFYKNPTTYTMLHLSKNMVNCVLGQYLLYMGMLHPIYISQLCHGNY